MDIFKDGFKKQWLSLSEAYRSQVCGNNDESAIFNHVSKSRLSYLYVQTTQSTLVNVPLTNEPNPDRT